MCLHNSKQCTTTQCNAALETCAVPVQLMLLKRTMQCFAVLQVTAVPGSGGGAQEGGTR